MKKIFWAVLFLVTLVSCAAEDTVTVDFPFRDCSFGLVCESVSADDNTTTVKLEREYNFTDGDFLPVLKPYKNEPDIALDIREKYFRITKKAGGAAGIGDVLLTAVVDGTEIARYGVQGPLEFSHSVTDKAWQEFVDAFFSAVVVEHRTVRVVFTGTLLDYAAAEADRGKVLVTYDFLQLMLARITIKR